MYIFKSDINKNEYDHFVENHPSCNLLQSYDWANIKNNWKPIYTGVYAVSYTHLTLPTTPY